MSLAIRRPLCDGSFDAGQSAPDNVPLPAKEGGSILPAPARYVEDEIYHGKGETQQDEEKSDDEDHGAPQRLRICGAPSVHEPSKCGAPAHERDDKTGDHHGELRFQGFPWILPRVFQPLAPLHSVTISRSSAA